MPGLPAENHRQPDYGLCSTDAWITHLPLYEALHCRLGLTLEIFLRVGLQFLPIHLVGIRNQEVPDVELQTMTIRT